MRKLIQSYTERVLNRLLINLQSLGLDLDPGKIHAIRVDLKRIRFIALLMKDFCPNTDMDGAYKPFGKIFKEAGKLRGEHINAYRKDKLESDDRGGDIKQVTGKEKTRKHLQKAVRHSLLHLQYDISVFKELTRNFPNLSQNDFFQKFTANLISGLNANTPKGKLHKNRHLLKGVMYASEISSVLHKYLQHKLDLGQVAKLEDAIGDWHDLSVIIQGNKKKKNLSKKALKKGKLLRNEKLAFIYFGIARLVGSS